MKARRETLRKVATKMESGQFDLPAAELTLPNRQTPVEILVQNTTDTAVGTFGVMEIVDSFLEVNDENFQSGERVFSATAPTTAEGIFAITQSPIKAGEVGKAILLGVSSVLLSGWEEGKNFACPTSGITNCLEASPTGRAAILWVEDPIASGRILRKAFVLLGGTYAPQMWGRVYSENFDHFGIDSGQVTPINATVSDNIQIDGIGWRWAGRYGWYYPQNGMVRVQSGKIVESMIPELNGVLSDEFIVGTDVTATVNLSDGMIWNDAQSITAYPAHNIRSGMTLENGTPVICRWNHLQNRWCFFIVDVGNTETVKANSGTAGKGFTTSNFSADLRLFAYQLAESAGVPDTYVRFPNIRMVPIISFGT